LKRPAIANYDFVHVVGDSLQAQVEDADEEHKVDHVWITIDPGLPFRLLLAVNTLSTKNRDAGFDPRLRIGLVRGEWELLPPRGVQPCDGFDYGEIEKANNVYYEPHEKEDMEAILLDASARAVMLEAWGTPYHRHRTGLHQIHSRRASCAVAREIFNRDGALRFYYPGHQTTELFLFKFCGQE